MPFYLLNILFEVDFLPFLLVVFIAWIVPILLNLFKLKRMPAPVVEIIIGFFLARHFIGGTTEATFFSLDFLGLIGLIFIMFLSGLEIDADQMVGSFPRKKVTVSGVGPGASAATGAGRTPREGPDQEAPGGGLRLRIDGGGGGSRPVPGADLPPLHHRR